MGVSIPTGKGKGRRIHDLTARTYRGLRLYAERGREIEPMHSTSPEGAYSVPSCSTDRRYLVVLGPGGGCSCRDTAQHCKHIVCAGLFRVDGGRHTVVESGGLYRVYDRELGHEVTGPTTSHEQVLEYMVEEIDDCREVRA